jgi:hypothetical protein
VTGQTIVDAMQKEGHENAFFEPDRKKLALEIGRMLEPGDCVLSLGAGNIHEAASILAKDVAFLDELQTIMGPGSAKLYEPLSKHTTMRVGGPAQFWAEPETAESRCSSLAAAPISSCGTAASAAWSRIWRAANSRRSRSGRAKSTPASA